MRIESSWSISIALSLALVAGGALAGDGDRRGNNRDERREQRQEGRPEQGQAPRQERVRDDRAMPPQYPQSGPTPQSPPPQQSDNGRRGGRMSPEDRRALRRQIDQASHDMYAPGR